MDGLGKRRIARILSTVELDKGELDRLGIESDTVEPEKVHDALRQLKSRHKLWEWGDWYSSIVTDGKADYFEMAEWLNFYSCSGISPPSIYVIGSGAPYENECIRTAKDAGDFFRRFEETHDIDIAQRKAKSALVIDDSDFQLADIESQLIEEGFAVETMMTGKGAPEKIRTGNYNVAIIDKILPDKGGGKILRETADCKDTAKILISSTTGPDDVEYMDAGADAIVPKSSPDLLIHSVKEAMGKRRKAIPYRQREEKILVMDDQGYVLDMVEYYLGKMGFKESNIFRTKEVGEPGRSGAYRILQDEMPDGVIADYRQAGMTGFLERLKEQDKPVILMSDYLNYVPDESKFCLFDVYLQKPVNGLTLVKSAEELFEERSWLKRKHTRPLEPGEKGRRIIIAGPPTSGKTYMCKVCANLIPSTELAIRDTTRKMRSEEKDGIDFNFMDKGEFYQKHGTKSLGFYPSDKDLYSTTVEGLEGKDKLIPISSREGLRLIATKYKDSKKIFMGISPQTMLERMLNRPLCERDTRAKDEREVGIRTKGYREYFPGKGGLFTFDLMLVSEGGHYEMKPIEKMFRETRKNALAISDYISYLRSMPR